MVKSLLRQGRVLARIERKAAGRARKIAEYIAADANLNSPVDTNRHKSHIGDPRLKGSFYVKMRNNQAIVVATRPYWIYVEKGVPSRDQDGVHMVAHAVEKAKRLYG